MDSKILKIIFDPKLNNKSKAKQILEHRNNKKNKILKDLDGNTILDKKHLDLMLIRDESTNNKGKTIDDYIYLDLKNSIDTFSKQFDNKSASNPVLISNMMYSVFFTLFYIAYTRQSEKEIINSLNYAKLSHSLINKSFLSDLSKQAEAQKIFMIIHAIAISNNHKDINAIYRLVSKATGIPEATICNYYLKNKNTDFWSSSTLPCKDYKAFINYHQNELRQLFEEYDLKSLKSGANKYDKNAFAALRKVIDFINSLEESN